MPCRRLLPVRPRLLITDSTLPLPSSALALSSAVRYYRVPPSDEPSKDCRITKKSSLSQLVLALRTFHSLEHHFAVPYSFKVPQSSTWPKELHHLPLGIKVHRFMQSQGKESAFALETRTQDTAELLHQLYDMGVPLGSWQTYQFKEVCLPALKTYQALYGDLFVPQKFIVPEHGVDADKWPRATRGFRLGLAVAKFRKQGQRQQPVQRDSTLSATSSSRAAALPPLSQYHVDALNALGFVWHVRETKWSRYFVPGLRQYKAIEGHVDVPRTFIVPQDPRWPATLSGYKLGQHVHMVRLGQYAAQVYQSRTELTELGFTLRVHDSVWRDRIVPALQVFATHYGHCDVAQDFVVPANRPWPPRSWGLKLGDKVKSIRRGAYASQVAVDRPALDALGFVWTPRQRVAQTVRQIVVPAFLTYQRLHGHDALVTTDFVVPEREAQWPEPTWGFRLGAWITRVRSGQVALSASLRAELTKVGFVWRSNDQRWHHVLLPAFRAYAHLHRGTCAAMRTTFVVPPEAPYPRAAWGVNLGGALWHIRNGDSYVQCHAKARDLRALGILPDGNAVASRPN